MGCHYSSLVEWPATRFRANLSYCPALTQGKFQRQHHFPFFPYRPVSARGPFAVDSARYENLSSSIGLFGIFKRKLSSTIYNGSSKIPPADSGGRDRRQLRFFGLFFNAVNVFGV